MRVAVFCFNCFLATAACTDHARVQRRTPPQVIVDTGEPAFGLTAGSLKFAIIGDSGRWSRQQRETATQLAAQHEKRAFDFVLMLGDNNYGDGSDESYKLRFEEPYKPLLDEGVKFYAVIGNHDPGPQWNYPPFNMGGQRYYTFERRAGILAPIAGARVQFFALDSVNLEHHQIGWFAEKVSESNAEWKVVYLHHPLYTSGRYSFSAALMRRSLESLLIEHQVDVVFAGHEHFYERLLPQRGVIHFISGAGGSVRTGDLHPSMYQASGYDRDLTFMLVEIAGNVMHFRAINRAGETVDSGRIVKTIGRLPGSRD
jgi:hypothetical protein